MEYYIDIILKRNSKFPSTVLMNKICTQLHKLLFELESKEIAISFPKYDITLGNLLRIHSNESKLEMLQNSDWLNEREPYYNISEVLAIPSCVRYRTVSRKRETMSQSKLNRLLKRGSISEQDIKAYKAKMFSKGLDNPYLDFISASNGHRYRRYIEFGELLDEPIAGEFDQFGLSKTATVPWF